MLFFKKKKELDDWNTPGGISWKKVLHELYEYIPHKYGRGENGFTDDHPLAKKLKISGHELMLSVSALEEYGLIRSSSGDFFSLTEKGFNVALENEKSLISIKYQYALLLLTMVLAIDAMVNAFKAIEGSSLVYYIGALFFGMTLLLAYASTRLELR